MKIEDVGYIPFASIFDQQKPVVDLLERLKSGDVLINPLDCEKDIEYTCLRQLRESRVPLMLQLEKLARVKSFLLRNESLEVELSDYTTIKKSMHHHDLKVVV